MRRRYRFALISSFLCILGLVFGDERFAGLELGAVITFLLPWPWIKEGQ